MACQKLPRAERWRARTIGRMRISGIGAVVGSLRPRSRARSSTVPPYWNGDRDLQIAFAGDQLVLNWQDQLHFLDVQPAAP